MIDCSDSFLLIDIGNSRTKWGVAKNGRIDPGEPFATQCFMNNPETLVSRWRNVLSPTQVVVANVAGSEIAACLVSWTQRCWNLAPRFVSSEAEGFGVHNAYFDPGKLGVDRWVALIGAHHACPGPVCVADFGTAITMDAINSEGVHLGGVIAPGLMLMHRSLVSGTHDLPLAGEAFHESLARETAAAIASGTRQAAAGLVERCYRETASKLGSLPRLLLTGGDAPTIAPLLGMPFKSRRDLVLEGLLIIAKTGLGGKGLPPYSP